MQTILRSLSGTAETCFRYQRVGNHLGSGGLFQRMPSSPVHRLDFARMHQMEHLSNINTLRGSRFPRPLTTVYSLSVISINHRILGHSVRGDFTRFSYNRPSPFSLLYARHNLQFQPLASSLATAISYAQVFIFLRNLYPPLIDCLGLDSRVSLISHEPVSRMPHHGLLANTQLAHTKKYTNGALI